MNTKDLITQLYHDFQDVKSGEISISKARTRKGIADSIINAKRLELIALATGAPQPLELLDETLALEAGDAN
jgi:hypothetical protein